MYESEHKIGKVRLEVEVELDDGARLLGFLFIKQDVSGSNPAGRANYFS